MPLRIFWNGVARNRLRLAAGFLGVVLLCASLAGITRIAAPELKTVRAASVENYSQGWTTFFGNIQAWSYSPLAQITRDNVKHLTRVWTFFAGGRRLESAPLVVDGILYLETPTNDVFAMDAATGKKIWKYTYRKSPAYPASQKDTGRGLATGFGMIFMGTNDNHVVAIDAKTGNETWNVEVESRYKCNCGINSAPLLVKDKVVTGVTGGEVAHRGYLSAFDAKTGKFVWRFYPIPAPGEPGSETWSGDSWKLGGGSTWYTGSYDPDLNLIYWGIGNPSSDFYGGDRIGSNLYTDSLVALNADTGKLKWYFQETPHDLWDYDSDPEPVLFDSGKSGATQRLVVHSSKNGYAYVLDRVTGKLLRTFPYVDTINWTKGLDKNGKPLDPVLVPEPGKDNLICPGVLGGRNRNHSAYSPRTGWWYSTSLELCSYLSVEKKDPAKVKEGDGWFAGTHKDEPNPNSSPHISAFDPLTGKKLWTFFTTYGNTSSLLATAGDLIFAGDVEGYAFALDAQTGEKIWSSDTGAIVASPPVSYSINGRQYIVIASGGGSFIDGAITLYWPESKGHIPRAGSRLSVFALAEK
jgi:alcohol dehydrogenase (cytochrome c)